MQMNFITLIIAEYTEMRIGKVMKTLETQTKLSYLPALEEIHWSSLGARFPP